MNRKVVGKIHVNLMGLRYPIISSRKGCELYYPPWNTRGILVKIRLKWHNGESVHAH